MTCHAHVPREPGDPKHPPPAVGSSGWAEAQWALGTGQGSRRLVKGVGGQALSQASGQKAQSQAEDQKARSWVWPGLEGAFSFFLG